MTYVADVTEGLMIMSQSEAKSSASHAYVSFAIMR